MESPTENQDVAGLHKTPTGIEGGFSLGQQTSYSPYWQH
jgi:hypothetical protein